MNLFTKTEGSLGLAITKDLKPVVTRRILSLAYGSSQKDTSISILLAMKLTFILLVVLIFNVRAEGFSQKVTYKAENVSIEKVFATIKKQTGYGFFVQEELISLARPVTINVVNEDLSSVLRTIFKDQPLDFSIKNKTILISKKAFVPLTQEELSPVQPSVAEKDIVVRGQITDAQGVGLPGVSVKLKGTSTGASTDVDGRFTITVPDNNSVLVLTYIGYLSQEVPVNGRTTINVRLEAGNTALTEVVVTALGISREKKALAYSVTEVKGEEFIQARENNIANALTGKIAGVNATGMATGPGGSSRVVIRGNGSLSGNNQPLYVINGMPMSNNHREIRLGENLTLVDRGDGIAAINPDDIETINVLKGGPAAALYGSQASNGVILITTKKGKIQNGVGVDINTSYSVGSPSMYPEFQYEYGQGQDGVKPKTKTESISSGRLNFGAKMDGQPYMQFDGVMRPYSPVNVKDNWQNFYRPATNLTNTAAFSGGTAESLVYRLSLSDLRSQAIDPGSSYNRQTANLNLRSVLGKKIIVEATMQYNLEAGKNRPGNGYADANTSWTANLLANTVDIRSLAPGYDPVTFQEIPWQQVPEAQNAYFVINRMGNGDTKNRYMGQASVQYNILDNLFIKASGMRDIDRFESMDFMPVGTLKRPLGLYNSAASFSHRTTGQLLMNYNTTIINNLTVNVLGGGSIERNLIEGTTNNGSEFIVPNFISYSNLALQKADVQFSQYGQNSLFGSADFGFKNLLYLTFTGRQDWFSQLRPGKNSIFYPSVGTSFILSDAIEMPGLISFAKLRASYAQVGQATVNPYQINQLYYFAQGGHLGRPVQLTNPDPLATGFNLSNPDLRPLTSTTYEGGIDLQFLNNRLGLDFTYYSRQTTDDIIAVPTAASSGATSALLNVGALSNKGVEILLTGAPIKGNNFGWDVSYNYAYNKSEVLKLAPGVASVNGSRVGDPFNTIQGVTYLTNASGVRVYNRLSGYEVSGPVQPYGVGVPPTTMGLTNNFRYKNFSLNMLIDGKFGNTVQSLLSRYMYRFGLKKETLPGRENGLTVTGVDQTGAPFTKTWPVDQMDTYYNNQASLSPLETSVFDGSFVKLRSVILSYRLPVNKLQFVKLQSADISLVSRNLAILYSKIKDFDPESNYTIDNNQGQSSNTTPRLREIGLNLIVKF